jgi:hypothetical protein
MPSVSGAGDPPGGEPALAYALDWSANDADGDALAATIEWGDGASQQVNVSPPYVPQSHGHVYAGPGAYDVEITVDDGRGGIAVARDVVYVGTDGDGDQYPDLYDNCPSIANADQRNTDSDPLDNGPMASGDEVTIVRGDTVGDVCDADIDNDGITNTDETAGPPCPAASAATNPLDIDTDGDHAHDGWECAKGSDPANSASVHIESGATDADGDRVNDEWEQRGYNASNASVDSDGDGCHDLVEAASVDSNRVISDSDRLTLARRALGIWPPQVEQDYVLDIDKNGFIGDADRLFVARAALLPDWLPKSCP